MADAAAAALRLPPDHPQRIELNDEVHARPPQALAAPLRLTYLALVADAAGRERQWQQVVDLVRRYGVEPPPAGATHFAADLGPFRLKWERHTEFSRYKFIVAGAGGEDPFAEPALAAVPQDWLAGLAGEVMVATHVALLPASGFAGDYEALGGRLFGGNTLVGAVIAGGAATAFTDFRIRADGFGRLLVLDRGMTPRQAGRMIQRLVEIDTYRIMALLALPVARALAPAITRSEHELAEITTALAAARVEDEAALLDRLTRLEAEIEGRQADTHYRFGAASAYWSLVDRRIAELREERLPGLQTFREFTERRLAPAMDTCRAVAGRQESLSQRVSRATQLLSTRVDVTRERQTQAILESMDRRARLQLRLQETVEGLSIAAITYYIVGLVGYLAKGLKAGGLHIDPEITMGIAIPVVAILVALGVRQVRRMVTKAAE
ncbi:MAG: DUF3422 domain-containing protein [Dongiaceae bacterium]